MNNDWLELEGKTVIVTGAASGIGKAVAQEFLNIGANVVISDMAENAPEMDAKEGQLLYVRTDVTKVSDVEAMVAKTIETFGTIDVLVNNAGITKDMLLMRMSEEEFDSVIQTNLKGTFNMIRHVSSVMLKQRSGAIINMSSVVGVTGNAGQANYAASKAGVIGLTKATAKELAARGVTCNAIAPGFVETDMTAVLTDEQKSMMLEAIPLKRYGQVEDIANAAVFLASDKASYITGQVLLVDGGMVM